MINLEISNICNNQNIKQTLDSVKDKINKNNPDYLTPNVAIKFTNSLFALLGMKKSDLSDIELITKCLGLFLRNVPAVTFVFSTINNFKLIVDAFFNMDSKYIRMDCVIIINTVVLSSPNLLKQTIFPSQIGKGIQFVFNNEEHNTNIVFMSILSKFNENPNNIPYTLPFINQFFLILNNNQNDVVLSGLLVEVISSIGKYCKLSKEDIQTFTKSINLKLKKTILVSVCQMLNIQVTKYSNYKEVAQSDIDIENLLSMSCISSYTHDLQKELCNLIIETITPSFYTQGTFERSEEQCEFAKKVQPSIIKTIIKRPRLPLHLMKALISTMQYNVMPLTRVLYSALYEFAKYPNYCGAVCYFCHLVINDPMTKGCYLFSAAQNTYKTMGEPPKDTIIVSPITFNIFAKMKYDYNQNVFPDSIEGVLDGLDNGTISLTELMYGGFMENCLKILKTKPAIDYKKLGEYMMKCLDFIKFDRVDEEIYNYKEIIDFLQKKVKFLVKCPNGKVIITYFQPCDSVVSVIGRLLTTNEVRDEFNSLRKDYLYPVSTAPGTLFQIMNGLKEHPIEYVVVTDDGREFGMEYSLIDIIAYQHLNYNRFSWNVPINLTIRERTVPRADNGYFENKPLKDNEQCLLDILKICNDISPVGVSSTLSRILFFDLKTISRTVALNTNSFYVINNYSFLIEEKLKMFAMRVQIIHSAARLGEIANFFTTNTIFMTHFNYDSPLEIVMPRKGLFDILKTHFLNVLATPIYLFIRFKNEEGIGKGPTKEFFVNLFEEVINPEKGMFRMTKRGYFPFPNAKPEDFYLLGIMTGKAIILNTVTGVTISPEFFKIVYGQTPTIEEVDPDLCELLKNPENFIIPGGMEVPYEFPGCNDFFNGGDITVDNVNQYITDVKNNIINDNIFNLAAKFREGLHSTIPCNAEFKLLTPEQMTYAICGQDNLMLSVDLISKYTIVDAGYTKSSPQVQWCFEFIVSATPEKRRAFINFVTANEFLPFGGFAALNPHFAIFKLQSANPDKHFPQSSTCSSLLKLPEYSSKEILFEKLNEAITQGNGKFTLL